jgi:transposase
MKANTNTPKLIEQLLGIESQVVKLGIDQHARDVVVSIQIDGSLPQRGRRMSTSQLIALVGALVAAGKQVYSCYEAGPCGYWLHRALCHAGSSNFVVAPVSLSGPRNQKTDALDALGLVDQLDRYLRGHTKAFTPVSVPTPEQEQARSQGRLRDQIKQSLGQWSARGRSLLLNQGFHVTGHWWLSIHWEQLKEKLPPWIADELATMRVPILDLHRQELALQKQLQAAAQPGLPRFVGSLSWTLIEREVRDWGRFNNRRQVASYTGLCPGVSQSGTSKRDGNINRCGNRRLRALLIEMVWRLARHQPDYPPVRKLVEGAARGAAKRKLAVAAARRLAIDLWRLATGQTKAENLHLVTAPTPSDAGTQGRCSA